MRPRDYAVLMAEYNAWMNRRVYELCATLSDDDYRRDLGAFFGSIHATLNHITWTDQLFLAWLRGGAVTLGEPTTILFEAFAALRAERERLDQRIIDWAAELEDDSFDRKLPLPGKANKLAPLYVIATQMFNHQTHHRGQVTALLTRLGVDPGATDIPAMPMFRELIEHVEPAPAPAPAPAPNRR